MKTLVALPFLGEIGWLSFSWCQLVYKKYLDGKYDKCIVYCNGGADAFFPYAEVRKFKVPFEYFSECNQVHNVNNAKKKLVDFENQIQKEVLKEVGCADFIRTTDFKFGSPLYNSCQSFRLKGTYQTGGLHSPLISVCLRDRDLGKDRNWPIEKWVELVKVLKENLTGYWKDATICVVGKVRKDWEDYFKDDVVNLLNKTNLSELAGVLSQSDLAIGGSTGTLHIASLCATDHLVWCTERTAQRYYETNCHNVQCHCIIDAEPWNPSINNILIPFKNYITKGTF